MESGLEQDFSGIDIADAGNEPLIEEQWLDATAPALEKFKKGGEAKLQRFWAEASEFRRAFRF